MHNIKVIQKYQLFSKTRKTKKKKSHTIIEHDQTPYTASLKFPGKKSFGEFLISYIVELIRY